MATRGRKPLPTAVKILEGDRGKGRRPLNRNEPVPNADQVKCPTWLMPEAKKEWKRLAPSLVAMGVLTNCSGIKPIGSRFARNTMTKKQEMVCKKIELRRTAVLTKPEGFS